ncbi:ABC transporter permease [Herbiconiux sp. SYSU D00978]|uniref:ABC transporter permease n=1 Tax=Herbiconiux sp. SYSU D00978 TaxID=2812562 RepID=UPI001A97A0B7|nr:ABC transporter permease [Herbiconiux sp. SYSU D00978]
MTTQTKAPVAAPSFVQSTLLVANREITTKLRSKSFLISTGILLLAVLASIVISGFAARDAASSTIPVATTAETSDVADLPGLDVTQASDAAEAEQLVRDGHVDAAVLPSSSASGYEIIGLEDVPDGLVQALSVSPEVTILEPADQDELIVYFVSIAFGLAFFMSAITFGQMIVQSVVEEKSTRVVEILMSAIPARALLAGKVLGNSALAFAQILAIALLSAVGLLVTGQDVLLGDLGPSIAWFVVFFVIGFVLLAAAFAASAALVSRQEDAGTVTTPVMMLVMIPYFLIILFGDNEFIVGIMSYVPFSAPVGMPMRIFLGTAEWWEPLLSLAIIIVSTVVVVLAGSKIYENALLRMGARVKLRDALKG